MDKRKRWYRKWDLDVSRETVEKVVAECNTPDKYAKGGGILNGPYTPPDSEDLIGKTLVFRSEGVEMTFEITGINELIFSENGGEKKTCFTKVKTLNHEIYLINQLIPGYTMSRQISLVVDMVSGYATVCDAHFGTPYSSIDVERSFIFGRLDGDFAPGEMHHFTSELVGRAIEWKYSDKIMLIKHMYTSDLYYTYSAAAPNGAWMATNPADYVKVRDNTFIFSFVEERQAGLQGFFVIDTDLMHDMGVFYGCSADHISSNCVGAIGHWADCTTVFDK